MNHTLLLLAVAVLPAFSQTPAAPPPGTRLPGAFAPVAASNGTTASRVSRVIAGPDGRAQGLLLRNGTYVTLSPGLSQQIPSGFSHNSSVRVTGPQFGRGSDKTIQAQQVIIAGVAYNDVAGAAGPAGPPSPNRPPSPPPPPRGARPGAAPPPPSPVGNGPVPPPPPPMGAALPPPQPQGASAIPPPATNGATPPPMPADPASPAGGQPRYPTRPSVQN